MQVLSIFYVIFGEKSNEFMIEEKVKAKQNSLLNERIESGRLLLVPISMDYKEEIFKEFTKDITTFMYPKPADDISETEVFINNSLKELEEGSNLQLVVVKKESGEFLGCGGLHKVNTRTPELGIWLKKTAHGNGYGREAMAITKEWADKNLDYEYILYPVAEKNAPSRKIPESLGGKIEREYDSEGLGGNKFYCLEYRIYKD